MSTAADEWVRKHRLNVDEYYRMAEVGLLTQDTRVELIEGEIIDMAPIGSRHAALVDKLTRILVRAFADGAIVGTQRPIRLGDRSEPQPDLTLLKYRADFYSGAHPTAADVLLVIEVSDSTLRYDSEIKLPLYARHGIPEVWIMDLGQKRWHRFRRPRDGGYSVAEVFDPGSPMSVEVAGVKIELNKLFE